MCAPEIGEDLRVVCSLAVTSMFHSNKSNVMFDLVRNESSAHNVFENRQDAPQKKRRTYSCLNALSLAGLSVPLAEHEYSMGSNSCSCKTKLALIWSWFYYGYLNGDEMQLMREREKTERSWNKKNAANWCRLSRKWRWKFYSFFPSWARGFFYFGFVLAVKRHQCRNEVEILSENRKKRAEL